MTPWTQNVLRWSQDVARFIIWIILIANALMCAVFSVWWTARFLLRLSDWFMRTMFSKPW